MRPKYKGLDNDQYIKTVGEALSTSQLREFLYQEFDQAEEEGYDVESVQFTDLMAKKYGINTRRVVSFRQSWANELYRNKTMEMKLKMKNYEMENQFEEMKLTKCPMCRQYKEDLKEKKESWKEERLEFKERVKELEKEVKTLDKEKQDLRMQVIELKTKAPADSSPRLSKIEEMIWDKGMNNLTGPRSDVETVANILIDKAPELMREGKDLVKEVAKASSERPPEPRQAKVGGKVPKQYRGPKPQRLSGGSRQNPPQKPREANGLNKLGEAFIKRYRDIPIDQVKIASDHILQNYNSLGIDYMAKMMKDLFRLLSRMREITSYVKKIRDKKPFPIINRALTAKDAAEFMWQEEPTLAQELSDKECDYIVGLMAPFAKHPEYANEYAYLTDQESLQVIEDILSNLSEFNRGD